MFEDYTFEFSSIGNDEDISRNAPVNRAARNVLVMDAQHLLKGSDVALLDYIAVHDALRAGLAIVLLHAHLIPSVTEAVATVEKVLEVKGITAPVHVEGKGNTGVWLVQHFISNPVNLDDVAREKARDIDVFVQASLEEQLARVEGKLDILSTIAQSLEKARAALDDGIDPDEEALARHRQELEDLIAAVHRKEEQVRTRSIRRYEAALRDLRGNPTAKAREELGEAFESLRKLLER